MTREEAIEVIKEVRFDINTKINGTTRFSQALEIAIKALGQEPILDKIRAELTEKRDILVKEARANTINPLSCYGLDYALLIIDKYRAENEER